MAKKAEKSKVEQVYPDCWVFSESRRVYRRNASGQGIGGPIWREHWLKVEIVGETSRSWLTSWGQKIPKKGGPHIAFSLADIDRQVFIQERFAIGDAVRQCRDYETLRAIADLINYQSEDQ